MPIMVLEARALLNTLGAIKANIKGHRVVVFVDRYFFHAKSHCGP